MTITYTTGIPDANHNPATDQPNMRTNNDNISAIIGIDHCTFNVTAPEISGQHLHVTFPEAQADPSLTQVQTQIYPKQFGDPSTSTVLLETYTAGRMSNNAQINGYLPFVKCMARFTGEPGPYPKTLSVPSNTLKINLDSVAGIVQSTTNVSRPGDTITIKFATALAYNTYYVFLEPSALAFPFGLTITKNLSTIVLQVIGANATFSGLTLGFMVI